MICTSSISPWRSAAAAEPDGDDLGNVGDRGVLSAAEHRRKLRFRLRARGEDVGRDRVQRMVCDCGRSVAHVDLQPRGAAALLRVRRGARPFFVAPLRAHLGGCFHIIGNLEAMHD